MELKANATNLIDRNTMLIGNLENVIIGNHHYEVEHRSRMHTFGYGQLLSVKLLTKSLVLRHTSTCILNYLYIFIQHVCTHVPTWYKIDTFALSIIYHGCPHVQFSGEGLFIQLVCKNVR